MTDSRHILQYGPWFKDTSMSQRIYLISTDEGIFIQLNLWDVLRLLDFYSDPWKDFSDNIPIDDKKWTCIKM